MTDDLYVNDGATFVDNTFYGEEDQAQAEEIRIQKDTVHASYPIMENVSKWFDEQIKQADSLNNIQTEEITNLPTNISVKVSIEAQLYAWKLVANILSQKKTEFGEFAEHQDE